MSDEYRFFKLGTGSRIALAASLWVLGVSLELALGFVLPGAVLVVAGWVPLMLRKATNKPEDQGLEEWRAVSMAEVDKLDDAMRQSRALKKKAVDAGGLLAIGLGGPALALAVIGSLAADRTDAVFYLLNGAAFLFPAVAFGRVQVFMPKEIGMKMPCFRAVLSETLPPSIAVAPYIRFDKDPKGADVPEDLRLMLELKRPPADLVGIQVQAAINKGPNGEVPYLYAVVLTKGQGPSYGYAKRVRVRGFEVEPGGDGEYGTVVIRQATTGNGYHTTKGDCERLSRLCAKVLEGISAGASE